MPEFNFNDEQHVIVERFAALTADLFSVAHDDVPEEIARLRLVVGKALRTQLRADPALTGQVPTATGINAFVSD